MKDRSTMLMEDVENTESEVIYYPEWDFCEYCPNVCKLYGRTMCYGEYFKACVNHNLHVKDDA